MNRFRRRFGKGLSRESDKPTILERVNEIKSSEPCRLDEAFIIFVHTVLVSAISNNSKWRQSTVLKGGTGLKLYLGESIGRVSKDIDLTLRRNPSTLFGPSEFREDILSWCESLLKRNYSDAASIELNLIDEPNSDQHHKNQAYVYRIMASLARKGQRDLLAHDQHFKMEISAAEYLDDGHLIDINKEVNGMKVNIVSYNAIQMMAEKLRALLQKCKKYEERGNPASLAPRHVVDLIPLMKIIEREGLSLDDLPRLFQDKCNNVNIPESYITHSRMLHLAMKKRVVDEYPDNGLEAWKILETLVEGHLEIVP